MRIGIAFIFAVVSTVVVFSQEAEPIQLVEFKQSGCDKSSDPYRIKPRIISLQHTGDTLSMQIGAAFDCCLKYVPQIEFSSDTLFLRFGTDDEQSSCLCLCCYSFEYTIVGMESRSFTVKLYDQIIEVSSEKYWTYPQTYSLHRGDTVNRTDKYGLKQGLWINDYDDGFVKYKDGKLDGWGRYVNYKVVEYYDAGTGIQHEYHPNGRLKRKCRRTTNGVLYECVEWKPNGRRIIN